MAYEALRYYADAGHRVQVRVHVDSTDFVEATRDLAADETLFIISSKTFGTLETLTNATSARDWIVSARWAEDAVAKHFVAVSTNAERVASSASTRRTCSGSGTGSAAGTRWTRPSGCPRWWRSGPERFGEMLAGFHEMDEHFRTAPLERNLPVLMGRSRCGTGTSSACRPTA